MQTRSSSRLVRNQSSNSTSSTNQNPKGRNHRRSKQRIENFNLEELSPHVVMMADQRTMAQLLQAPIEGYEDAIVVPAITGDSFELKHGLLTLVQNKQEAWDRFKDILRACPHHGFSELHQLDTFYNALNSKDQDSLNFAVEGNFLDKMPRECLAIIESKSIVRYSRDKPVVAKVSTNTSTFGVSPDVVELKDMVKALLLDKKATDGNNYRDYIQEFVSQASAVNYNQGNTNYRPPMISNRIRPPGFPPVPNNQNVQRKNQNRFIPNQNRGNNFNQGPVYQPLVFQPPAYQAHAYQAPAPQTQGVSKEDFSAY
nr:reverse transcriptase domain-containing protein [Tanacetum cinerariifolium]